MMKMNKFLLAALALPVAFTACTQEELVPQQNEVSMGGDIKVSLNVNKESAFEGATRADWANNQLQFVPGDKVSMFWLGADATMYAKYPGSGFSNAVFTTSDGVGFTSPSLVYLGKNVVVYPADLAHVSNKAIEISVPQIQPAGTVDNVPFISNELNISGENVDKNKGGYDNKVDAPMKMAANVVELTLNVKNADVLKKYDFDITSVELHADAAFATMSNVVEGNGELKYKSEQKYGKDGKVNTITTSLWTEAVKKVNSLTSKDITANENGTYTVRFVVLPTDLTVEPTNAQIVVNTTCGKIYMTSSKKTEGENTIYTNYFVNPNIAADKDGHLTSIPATIKNAFTHSYTNTDENSKFTKEYAGRFIPRTIDVDASTAVLTGSEVYTSADIIRYVDLYTDMKKTDPMNLVMSVDGLEAGKTAPWVKLTKEAVDKVDGKNNYKDSKYNVTLKKDNTVSEIQLSTAGAVYNVPAYQGENTTLVLTSGNWTMGSEMTINGKFTTFINKGTLTVSSNTNNDGIIAMTQKLTNAGTLNFAGQNTMKLTDNLTNTGIINVAENQILNFTKSQETGLGGTINVNKGAEMTVADNVKISLNATVNNSGLIASEGTELGFYNNGTINMKDASAILYIQENTNGTINLVNRNDEVVVNTSGAKGKIVYNYVVANDTKNFELKATDRFTYVVFGNDADVIYLKPNNSNPITGISMEFTGTTQLEPESKTIKDLTITKNAHVKLLSERTLNVTNLYHYGQLTIGGTINYTDEYDSYDEINQVAGSLRNPGTGSIKKIQKN